MTAMCAPSASQTPSTASSPRDLVASLRTVVLPGSPATYANRAYLRDLGLRWDPANHRWHGRTTTESVRELRERLGLEVRCFGDLGALPKGPVAPKPAIPRPAAAPIAVSARDPPRRLLDGSRTRVEARVAYPEPYEEPDEITTPNRRFSILEVTAGLPDDCREADEREAERRQRDVQGRVKVARAIMSTTPGLAEMLARDWRKAAQFYARYGVTESMLQHGGEAGGTPDSYPVETVRHLIDTLA